MKKKSWRDRMLLEKRELSDDPLEIRLSPAMVKQIREFNPGWELGCGLEPKLPPAIERQISADSRKTLITLLAHSIEAPDGTLRMGPTLNDDGSVRRN